MNYRVVLHPEGDWARPSCGGLYPSRDAATKNWKEFREHPEWVKVSKASEADGKIVEKVDSTFMEPTDFSKIK